MRFLLIFLLLSLPCLALAQTPTTPPDLTEKMPEFPGGQAAMVRYINDHVNYPKAARKARIEGKVYVKFMIDTLGNVQQAQVKQGLGGGCDEEALRVVQSLPRSVPGMHHGRPVAVWFFVPVEFRRF